jgi:hypothetical protein
MTNAIRDSKIDTDLDSKADDTGLRTKTGPKTDSFKSIDSFFELVHSEYYFKV